MGRKRDRTPRLSYMPLATGWHRCCIKQPLSRDSDGSEDRIRNGCKKIVKSRQGSTQGRLDSFFTVTGSLSSKRKVTKEQPPMWAAMPWCRWSSEQHPLRRVCSGGVVFEKSDPLVLFVPMQEPEAKGSAKKKQKTGATPGKFKKGK